METSDMSVIEQIFDLFNNHGGSLYFGEQVTETEHALQAAHLARQAGAADEVIAGALLHDIGHLMHGLGEDIAEHGVDGKHEDVGASWLEGKFPQVVIDCVRLHVAAKRYLTAADPGYLEGLSAASVESLRLQGGPFSDEEVAEFERSEPNFETAIQVRRWDDEAKVVGLAVPAVESYRDVLERVFLG
ncbi:MAG: HDIG domain-containing metalloprotein [Armatimonadota bacterium]